MNSHTDYLLLHRYIHTTVLCVRNLSQNPVFIHDHEVFSLTYVTYLLIFHTAKNNDAHTLVWRNIQQIKKAVTYCIENRFQIPQEKMGKNHSKLSK